MFVNYKSCVLKKKKNRRALKNRECEERSYLVFRKEMVTSNEETKIMMKCRVKVSTTNQSRNTPKILLRMIYIKNRWIIFEDENIHMNKLNRR